MGNLTAVVPVFLNYKSKTGRDIFIQVEKIIRIEFVRTAADKEVAAVYWVNKEHAEIVDEEMSAALRAYLSNQGSVNIYW